MAVNPYDKNLYAQATNNYATAAQNVMPTQQTLDTADARLKARMASEGAGLQQQIRDMFSGRGRTNSGAYDARRMQGLGQTQSSIATGLAENWKNYQDQRMAGASKLADIGSAQGQLSLGAGQNVLNQYSTDVTRELGLGRNANERYATEIEKQLGQEKNANDRYSTDITKLLGLEGLKSQGDQAAKEYEINRAKNAIDAILAFGQVGKAANADDFSGNFKNLQGILLNLFGSQYQDYIPEDYIPSFGGGR